MHLAEVLGINEFLLHAHQGIARILIDDASSIGQAENGKRRHSPQVPWHGSDSFRVPRRDSILWRDMPSLSKLSVVTRGNLKKSELQQKKTEVWTGKEPASSPSPPRRREGTAHNLSLRRRRLGRANSIAVVAVSRSSSHRGEGRLVVPQPDP